MTYPPLQTIGASRLGGEFAFTAKRLKLESLEEICTDLNRQALAEASNCAQPLGIMVLGSMIGGSDILSPSETHQVLAKWLHTYVCTYGDRLLRPLVVHGRVAPSGVVVLGINPATAITAELAGMSVDAYKQTLLDEGQFEPFYRQMRARLGLGAEGSSHRRIGALVRALRQRGDLVVVSNIYAYPTGKAEKLKRFLQSIPAEDVRALQAHVPWVVSTVRPRVVVCLGNDAEDCAKRLLPQGWPLRRIQHPSPRQTYSDSEWETACDHLLASLPSTVQTERGI